MAELEQLESEAEKLGKEAITGLRSDVQRAKAGLGENFFALIFVSIGIVLMLLLWRRNPDIMLEEVTGMKVHGLLLYTMYWAPFLFFVGGRKFKVIAWFKEHPIAMAIILHGIITGASNLLGK